ncbi:MAG: TRAP transporter large permease subunit [Leptospiraceae bacterium]|nr:TRAP transporter large permease subunit [Leptospiraceae bacterium]
MIFEWLAPLMFLSLLALIFTGYPVAFSLGGIAVIFGFFSSILGYFNPKLFMAITERSFGIMSNYILLAVPFFIFMGIILEKSKLAEGLLKTIGLLFGPLRGGLALAVIFVGILLAAATGVVGASVVAMGMISLPVMLKYGYSKELASGIIAASGTLGQIIPPSVVLIVLGDQMGISVGDLFAAAIVPGLILAFLYILYILGIAFFSPSKAPALPKSERQIPLPLLLKKTAFVMLPPLLLIVLVLGGVFVGLATPTEAGALGALGAIILALMNRSLKLANLKQSMNETMRLTVMILFLLIGSTAFSLVFRCLDGDLWVQDLLLNLPGGKIGFLVFSNLLIFLLGFFIDFFEIVFILVPLLVPAAKKIGIDLGWYAVLIAMNLQTSFLTPPFGFSLFYLRGVAPESIKTSDIYRGVVPFLLIQIFTLGVLILFPGIIKFGGV